MPWFSRVSSTILLKTMWEKEKLLITSNFSFSPNAFYPYGELPAVSLNLQLLSANSFSLEESKICCVMVAQKPKHLTDIDEFRCPCGRRLENIASFSHNVFYPIKEKLHHYKPQCYFSMQVLSVWTRLRSCHLVKVLPIKQWKVTSKVFWIVMPHFDYFCLKSGTLE